MRPLLHPSLVNGRSGDPALYVETLFESRAMLFDLGDIALLSPRKVQRLEHIFLSHAHMDHFAGFDHLLRLLVGRDKTIRLYGPEGFISHVGHKLHGYAWNLAAGYPCDLVFIVTEIAASFETRAAQFRLQRAFAEEPGGKGRIGDHVLYQEPSFRVRVSILDHRIPCLAFAIEEAMHVNVWKTRLAEAGLQVGAWLRELKRAVTQNMPDEYPIRIATPGAVRELPLRSLRHVVTVTAGQKIGYVTDIADTTANRESIIRLVRNADLLFIEAAFAEADAGLAQQRAHLTTAAAGQIARAAGVRRVEPFHFSPRYAGEDERMLNEVRAAFAGECSG
jgi:ribonuclease Z